MKTLLRILALVIMTVLMFSMTKCSSGETESANRAQAATYKADRTGDRI